MKFQDIPFRSRKENARIWLLRLTVGFKSVIHKTAWRRPSEPSWFGWNVKRALDLMCVVSQIKKHGDVRCVVQDCCWGKEEGSFLALLAGRGALLVCCLFCTNVACSATPASKTWYLLLFSSTSSSFLYSFHSLS